MPQRLNIIGTGCQSQVARGRLLILSYETLSRNIEHLKRKGPYQPYGLLVCDEVRPVPTKVLVGEAVGG